MIKIGMIGAGGWGKNLLRSFYYLPGVEVAMLADLVPERREEARHRYPGIETTDDYRSFLDSDDIQAVVVATPGASHYAIARECLAAGKDVFVEKPMTIHAGEAEELARLADDKKLILMAGHLMLYNPSVRKLKAELEAGALGDLYYLYFQRLNLGKIRKSENAMWTFAPHDISIARYLVGSPALAVAAWGESYVQPGVADVAFVRIRFPGNVIAHIHVSWLDPHKVRRVTLVGSRKMMVFDDMDAAEPIRVYDKGVPADLSYDTFGEYLNLRSGDIHIPWVKSAEPLRLECAHFIDCVRDRSRPLSDGWNGAEVVKILEAAQMSMESGGDMIEL